MNFCVNVSLCVRCLPLPYVLRLLSTTTTGICTNWTGDLSSFKACVKFKIWKIVTGLMFRSNRYYLSNYLLNSSQLCETMQCVTRNDCSTCPLITDICFSKLSLSYPLSVCKIKSMTSSPVYICHAVNGLGTVVMPHLRLVHNHFCQGHVSMVHHCSTNRHSCCAFGWLCAQQATLHSGHLLTCFSLSNLALGKSKLDQISK